MKKQLLAILSAFFASSAFAASPSLFECKSTAGDLEVSYTVTSFSGEPTFDVRKDGASLVYGNDVEMTLDSKDTAHGTIVSAHVVRPRVMDAPSLTMSLIIPQIELGSAHEIEFNTFFLRGSSTGFLMLPAAFQSLESVTKVSCKGQLVYF